MNRFPLSALILIVALAACSDNNEEQQADITPLPQRPKQQASQPVEQTSAPVADTQNFADFNINSIPVSSKSLGAFPYFDAPDGYVYATSKERPLEEKYFFDKDGKLIEAKGKYFIGQLEPKQNSAEATDMVIASYDKAITAAGGVKLFEGSAPEFLRSEYSKNAPPSYWRDMYSPLSARFVQYVINHGSDSVWVELAINPGTTRIDLSVVQQNAGATNTSASAPATATATASAAQ